MTDLYQLTMMAADHYAGRGDKVSTFDLFVRRLPAQRNYLVACGLEEAVGYLGGLRFTGQQIGYLRSLPEFADKPEFLERLGSLGFTGDLWAAREGTPVFGNEPMLTVRAPLLEAQLVETHLLTLMGSRTMFAAKAARIVEATAPMSAMEFGTRRSHDPEAAIACARSAYIAGFVGTSNVEAGMRYGIPITGTMAHSFIMGFGTGTKNGIDPELEAFRAYAKAFPRKTVLLVDTYDTIEGTKKAIIVAKEMEASGERLFGIRIDSADLAKDSAAARDLLDSAGLKYVNIVLSNDLDEEKIAVLKANDARFNSVGVGTMVATSCDAPNLGVVYKLAEQEENGMMTPRIKSSEGKVTLPGLKQVYRYADKNGGIDHDEICLAAEPAPWATPLLQKVMEKGKLVSELPTLEEIRGYAREQRARLPETVRDNAQHQNLEVRISPRLDALKNELLAAVRGSPRRTAIMG